MFKRILVLGPAALLAAACGNDRPHPTAVAVAPTATVAFSAVKFWEAGATVRWNELATDLAVAAPAPGDRKSTRLNSSHQIISYAVFCLKKKTQTFGSSN